MYPISVNSLHYDNKNNMDSFCPTASMIKQEEDPMVNQLLLTSKFLHPPLPNYDDQFFSFLDECTPDYGHKVVVPMKNQYEVPYALPVEYDLYHFSSPVTSTSTALFPDASPNTSYSDFHSTFSETSPNLSYYDLHSSYSDLSDLSLSVHPFDIDSSSSPFMVDPFYMQQLQMIDTLSVNPVHYMEMFPSNDISPSVPITTESCFDITCFQTTDKPMKKLKPKREVNNIRPYSCHICKRAFARKHDLQRHIRVHTGDKPYSCPCCKKAFARTDALKRHLSMEIQCQHSKEVQTMKKLGRKTFQNMQRK